MKCWAIVEVIDSTYTLKGIGMTVKAAMVGAKMLYDDADESFVVAVWDQRQQDWPGYELKHIELSMAIKGGAR